MIAFKQKGDFSKTRRYLERVKEKIKLGMLDKYGKQGVQALAEATPRDTGKTATSWSYEIQRNRDSVAVIFKNSNRVNGIPIAIILQYGHATKGGGYVQGRDYINPALRPIFDSMAREAWEEVTRL